MTAVALPHAAWCSGDYRCGLGEHRSHPHIAAVPGAGRVVITRVRAASGREHAEVRLTVELSGDEPRARGQLLALMRGLVLAVSRARRGR
jgi:hypothetical protein